MTFDNTGIPIIITLASGGILTIVAFIWRSVSAIAKIIPTMEEVRKDMREVRDMTVFSMQINGNVDSAMEQIKRAEIETHNFLLKRAGGQ